MSMRDYPVNDYGLLINWETMKSICSKYCDDYTPDGFNEDPFSYIDKVVYAFGIEYISGFTGDAIGIDAMGKADWDETSESFCDDVLFYLPTKKQPGLLGTAYSDISQVINEFKIALGKYLPEDFNYALYIRNIVGTYIG